MKDLPDSSIHMCMTSPPYFGLRDYGEEKQIGLEETLGEYIDKLVAVGEEIRRVLRDDGSWWLNIGDTYSGTSFVKKTSDYDTDLDPKKRPEKEKRRGEGELGPKNKMLVPHRVAIALQKSGWIVRNDATWRKPNPMPSPVKDRLNETTEQVFHLVPSRDYYYDLDSVREPHSQRSMERMTEGAVNADVEGRGTTDALNEKQLCHPNGKNPGDVFDVTTLPFPDAHFAVYPIKLCEKPIKTTVPEQVCSECGTPYGWVYEVTLEGGGDKTVTTTVAGQMGHVKVDTVEETRREPMCDCDTTEAEPGIVLDPFAGAGTTLLAAKELERQFTGIELNPEYADMARERIGLDLQNPENKRDKQQAGVEDYV